MNKRFFLQAGAAMVGSYALSRLFKPQDTETAVASSSKALDLPQKKESFEIAKTDAEWQDVLTPEQFHILREEGTEWAWSSPLNKEYRDGTYHCVGCDLPLFSSKTKFDSGTGWPSFYTPMDNAVGTHVDKRYNMVRTEVHCRRCGGHLGHVFPDGPAPTGQRYCINGIALKFVAS